MTNNNTYTSYQDILPAISPSQPHLTCQKPIFLQIKESNFIRNLKKANQITLSRKLRKRSSLIKDCVAQSLRGKTQQKPDASLSIEENWIKIITEDLKNRQQVCCLPRGDRKQGFTQNYHCKGNLGNEAQMQNVKRKKMTVNLLERQKSFKQRNRYKQTAFFRSKAKKLSLSHNNSLNNHKQSFQSNNNGQNSYFRADKALISAIRHLKQLKYRSYDNLKVKECQNINKSIKLNHFKETQRVFNGGYEICEWEHNAQNQFELDI